MLNLNKTCKRCAQTKPLEFFHKHKNMLDGHLNFCKSCSYEQKKANRLANPESRKKEHARLRDRLGFMTMDEYIAKRNENPKGRKTTQKEYALRNKEKIRVYQKQYEKLNKDKITSRKAATIDKRREVKRLWVKNNIGAVLASCAKRRSAKLLRTPKWLTEFDHLKMKCYYQVASMRSKESGQNWHVDHIIPLQGENVCGLHVPSNLQIIPAIENMRKNNHYEA